MVEEDEWLQHSAEVTGAHQPYDWPVMASFGAVNNFARSRDRQGCGFQESGSAHWSISCGSVSRKAIMPKKMAMTVALRQPHKVERGGRFSRTVDDASYK